MNPLFGSRRRAEDFAARADGVTGGGPVPADGARGADPAGDALLELVSALRDIGADDFATPRDAFSLDLRQRLVAEATTVLVAPPPDATPGRAGSKAPVRPARGWDRRKRRFATATATVAILMGGTAGMASAAQQSLPGEALYPVKRGLEKAAVTLSSSTVDRGRELLSQASGRLDEVQGLMDEGPAERVQIPATLDTFNEQATEGAELLISSYESTDDETAMVTLRKFAASSMHRIDDLTSTAPDQALTGLGEAAVLMHEVDTQADEACPGCIDLPALPDPEGVPFTTAAGTIGLPDAGVSPDGGSLLGVTTGELTPATGGLLAPLLPGLPDGQALLGVPGAPTTPGSAPVVTEGGITEGSTTEGSGTDTSGEEPVDNGGGGSGGDPTVTPSHPSTTPSPTPTSPAPETPPNEAPPSAAPTPSTHPPVESTPPAESPSVEQPTAPGESPSDSGDPSVEPSAGNSGNSENAGNSGDAGNSGSSENSGNAGISAGAGNSENAGNLGISAGAGHSQNAGNSDNAGNGNSAGAGNSENAGRPPQAPEQP